MNVGSLTIEMAAGVARLQKDMDAARRTVDSAVGDITQTINQLKGLLGGLFAGFTVGSFVQKLVSTQRQFDILSSSLITATGSAEAADKAFAWIKVFAAETPYSLNEVTGAFIKMKNLGLDASSAALRSYGNTASAMGKGLDQMIEAVADAATGEFERLKEFGIRSSKEGERVTFTFRGVSKTVSTSADEISGYLRKLGETEFAGAMERRAATLDGALSNLGDTWDELFRTVNESGTGTLIYDTVKLASGAVSDLILILKSMQDATKGVKEETSAFTVVQDAIGKVFETVAVLGANLMYVLDRIGDTLGGIAAAYVEVLKGNFENAREIGRQMSANGEIARAEVDSTSERILAARKPVTQLSAAVEENTDKVKKNAGASASAAKELKKFLDELKKFVSSQDAKTSGVDNDFYENMLMLRRGLDIGELSLDKYRETAEKYIKSQKFWVDREKEIADAIEEKNKQVIKELEDQEKNLAGIEEMIEQLEFEAQAVKMTNEQREIAIRLRELEKKGILEGTEAYDQYEKRIREAISGRAAVEEAKSKREETEKEWAKTWENVAESFTDALMEGGENLAGYLKKLFRATILSPTINAIMQPVQGLVQETMTNSLGSLLGMGSSLMGGGGGFGGIISSAITGGFQQVVAGWQGASLAAGLAGPTTAGAGGLMGLGNMLSAIPGWGWALAAVVAVAALWDDDSGTFHTGSSAQYDEEGGLQTSTTHGAFGTGFGGVEYSKEIEGIVGNIAKGLAMGLNEMAKTFNGKGGFQVATAFADDTSDDGAWGALRISRDGEDLLNWEDDRTSRWAPREFADGEEGYKEYLALVAKDTHKLLLEDMDLPGWATDVLKSIGESPTMEQLLASIAQINQMQAALGRFRDNIVGFSGVTDEAFSKLIKFSGGFEVLAANMDTYYANFYSSEEQRANTFSALDDEFKTLGLSVPKTREEYRNLVEAQDLNTEAGQKAYAMLLRLSGVFASVTESAEALAEAEAERARDVEERMFDINQRIIRAQGWDTLALENDRQREYDAYYKISPALAERLRQLWDIEDAEKARTDELRRQEEALAAVTAAREKAYGRLQNAVTLANEALDAQAEVLSKQREGVQVQRDMAAETVASVTGVFNILHNSARDLLGTVQSTSSALAAQGMKFIQNALATAQETGYLPDGSALQEAIGSARSGLTIEKYRSRSELDYDTMVLANQLGGLEAITGGQKTAAEQTVERLDKQLEFMDAQQRSIDEQRDTNQRTLDYWRRQIDIANGTFDVSVTIAEAIGGVADLIGQIITNTKAPVQAPPGTTAGGSGGASWGGSSGGSTTAPVQARYSNVVSAATVGNYYEPVIDPAEIAELDRLSPTYHSFDGTGDLWGLFAAMDNAGGSMKNIATLGGYFYNDVLRAAASIGYPAFEVGTDEVPHNMLAILHKGERVQPKRYNPALDNGNMTPELLASIAENSRAMRGQLDKANEVLNNIRSAVNGAPDAPVPVRLTGSKAVAA